MNCEFLIILVLALPVAAGYIAIFRSLGVAPGYGWLAGATMLFFCGILWSGWRNKKWPSSAN